MRLGFPPLTPVVKKILIANVAVFVLRAFTRPNNDFLGEWFAMWVPGVLHGQVWRLIGYQYLHSMSSLMHLFFNMLGLYFLGVHLERLWGGRKFFFFYTMSGLLGGIFYTLLVLINWLPSGVLVGASGCVLGCLGACAVLFPSMQLIIFVFPVPIRMAATLGVALYLLNLIGRGGNAGGDAAHLAGLAYGVLWPLYGQRYFQQFRTKQTQGAWARKVQRQADGEKRVDEILDKIQREGMGSLSRQEKKVLEQASAKQKDQQSSYGRTDRI